MAEVPQKPYLLRALFEWCVDNGYTPHLAVKVDSRTQVPPEYVKGGEITLNISPNAVHKLQMGNELIEFSARFGGVARQHVTDRLVELAPVFTKTKHMLGDDFTMLDVALAPLLWRLDHYGIKLGKTAAPLMKYAERIFSRPAFIEALTPSEKVMRK